MVSSILIIDLNVHQGNCIAEIFAGDPNVFAFSMNRANNFPFRKEKFELDISSPVGVADEQYLDLQKQTLPGLISRKKPNFIFYLAGVDVLASDKLGKMALTIDGCKGRHRFVFEQCIINKIPVQVSMGGGYSPDIKDIVNAHCNTYRLANEMYF